MSYYDFLLYSLGVESVAEPVAMVVAKMFWEPLERGM